MNELTYTYLCRRLLHLGNDTSAVLDQVFIYLYMVWLYKYVQSNDDIGDDLRGILKDRLQLPPSFYYGKSLNTLNYRGVSDA